MTALTAYALVCFGSVFSIVDPFAAVPIFLALIGDRPPSEQHRAALRAAITCTVVLLVFGAAGGLIMAFFSITISAFKIAGGILLFSVGFEMLRAKASSTRSTKEELAGAQSKDDVAVVPLGLPLLAGPGSMATVMVLAGKERALDHRVMLFIVVMAVGVLCYLVLRSAAFFGRALGQTGINLIGRIMGLILAAIAVQFIVDGAREAFPKLLG